MESLRNIRVPSAPRLFGFGKSTPSKRKLHVFHAHSWQLDKDGRIIWVEDGWSDNILHDDGELYILTNAFDSDFGAAYTRPTNLYLGLDNRATPAEGDTLATLSGEPAVANGYARKAISTVTGFTLSQPGAYYQAATANQAFVAAGGNWGSFKQRFVATTTDNTGKLLASIPFNGGVTRIVNDGDTLNTTAIIGMSE